MVKKTEKKVPAAVAVNKGAWTEEEDRKLRDYVLSHGDKKWRTLPVKAGLNRCGKSCRLRWLNYLRPGIKRGNISEDEEDLIIRLHNLIGNRWSLIAARLPGRTDNEIKNHWNTHLNKKSMTISDLNSKLNVSLEGSVSESPTSSPPTDDPTSPTLLTFPPETNQAAEAVLLPDTQNPVTGDTTTACALTTNDVGINSNFDACQSPSSLWFHPFPDDEFFHWSGYDDVCMAPADPMDNTFKDFFIYFPWS